MDIKDFRRLEKETFDNLEVEYIELDSWMGPEDYTNYVPDATFEALKMGGIKVTKELKKVIIRSSKKKAKKVFVPKGIDLKRPPQNGAVKLEEVLDVIDPEPIL